MGRKRGTLWTDEVGGILRPVLLGLLLLVILGSIIAASGSLMAILAPVQGVSELFHLK